MTQQERLQKIFEEKFGDDWRKEISLTIRADTLSWFVHLIEEGIEHRKEEFEFDAKDQGRTHLNAGEIASIASWRMDLEALVTKVEGIVKPLKKA